MFFLSFCFRSVLRLLPRFCVASFHQGRGATVRSACWLEIGGRQFLGLFQHFKRNQSGKD